MKVYVALMEDRMFYDASEKWDKELMESYMKDHDTKVIGVSTKRAKALEICKSYYARTVLHYYRHRMER